MGVLEAAARIVELGGAERSGRAAQMRALFEARTGTFSPEDPWFEERSRAFWCDAVTQGRFGREVEAELSAEDRSWLAPLEHAHRGLFRRAPERAHRADAETLLDVWSGAEIVITVLDDASRAELDAATGQLLDARVVGAEESPTRVRPSRSCRAPCFIRAMPRRPSRRSSKPRARGRSRPMTRSTRCCVWRERFARSRA